MAARVSPLSQPTLHQKVYGLFNQEQNLEELWNVLKIQNNSRPNGTTAQITWNGISVFQHSDYQGSVNLALFSETVFDHWNYELNQNRTLPKNVRILLFKIDEELSSLAKQADKLYKEQENKSCLFYNYAVFCGNYFDRNNYSTPKNAAMKFITASDYESTLRQNVPSSGFREATTQVFDEALIKPWDREHGIPRQNYSTFAQVQVTISRD